MAHEFLGPEVKGKTVIVVDDIISSGESMLDTARELKERGASRVIICCTFGLFTNGFETFDQFYQEGIIDYVITTNLNYRPDEASIVSNNLLKRCPVFAEMYITSAYGMKESTSVTFSVKR